MKGSAKKGSRSRTMKCTHSATTRRYVGTTGDIKKDLSQEQLAAIGAVAMAYNKG
jgi:hypothetical protein